MFIQGQKVKMDTKKRKENVRENNNWWKNQTRTK
jgi:hypothetical protein